MAFSLGNKESVSKVSVNDGPKTSKYKGVPVSDDIGIHIEYDTENKKLSGKVLLFNIDTDLANEKELYEALERTVNDVLKIKNIKRDKK